MSTASPAKLHELLAAEKSLKGQASIIFKETLALFGKPETFTGVTRSLSLFAAQETPEKKTQLEQAESTVQKRTTTVIERLGYHAESLAKLWDLRYQKDKTNQQATADIVIGGVVIAQAVPATFLLQLEQYLAEQRNIYASAPVLQNTREWKEAPSEGAHVWTEAHPEVAIKTEKVIKYPVKVAASEKHPAQVGEITENIAIGAFTTVRTSGMITSAKKSELLGKCDAMILAVKEARARANSVPVVGGQIGRSILAYIEN